MARQSAALGSGRSSDFGPSTYHIVGVCDVTERYQAVWLERVATAARRLGQAMSRSALEVANHTDEDGLVDAMIALESRLRVMIGMLNRGSRTRPSWSSTNTLAGCRNSRETRGKAFSLSSTAPPTGSGNTRTRSAPQASGPPLGEPAVSHVFTYPSIPKPGSRSSRRSDSLSLTLSRITARSSSLFMALAGSDMRLCARNFVTRRCFATAQVRWRRYSILLPTRGTSLRSAARCPWSNTY
ncbi:hypothetical protein C8N24_0646 [Solirubrobacter pauli]|uniref:Uncharacterized protein n=1 Tax=Solirubrobacter pauli TaxID=166793 RepID=A0A660LDM3_9ACTN|nr:hypothetical protein C8N24_0646 [Solirubrobacter pauli]